MMGLNSRVRLRRSALVEAAISELNEADRPLSLQHLARAVLHVESGAATAASRALESLLQQDDRLQVGAAGQWELIAWQRRADALDVAEFVIFDIETNGGRGGRHRILEIGAERVRGGEVTGRFETLVRIPGRVSKFITRYTGVTEDMLVDAPDIERVLDDFREFQSGAVLVAHNLLTDLGYLNREAVWAQRPMFPGHGLDTMELMQVLMPEAEVSGLAGALEFLGERESPRHRALPDAQATHRLFAVLLDRAGARGIETVDALRKLSEQGGPEGPMPQRARELARWASRNLPPSPGVYVFRDSANQALYVGKTVSLQRRVRAHFTTSQSFVRQREDMLPRINNIDWEVTGSELRALLREAELITELGPVYNVQRQRHASPRLVHIGPAKTAVVKAASAFRSSTGDYVGPYRTARDARLASQAARRLMGMPSSRTGAVAVEAWRRNAALTYLRDGREAAIAVVTGADAAPGDRETILRGLRRSRVNRRPLAGGIGGDRVIVVDDGREPCDVDIALIENGQVVETLTLSRPRRRDVRRALGELLSLGELKTVFSSDHHNIVLAWLHAKADKCEFVQAPEDVPASTLEDQVWERVCRIVRS